MAHEDYTHPEYLVEPDWLATHYGDANVVVVDCDVDPAYNRGHIPGAVVVPDNFEKDPDYGDANVVVVDCDVDPAYNRGHIPGAVVVPDNFTTRAASIS